MNSARNNIEQNQQHQGLAAEVLELGESLFEIALEAGSHKPAEGEEGEAFPTEEFRAATQEFFSALRLLLGIEDK